MRRSATYLYLSECFDYDAETGILTWRVRPRHHFVSSHSMNSWNAKYPGRAAGTPNTNRGGYLLVTLFECRVLVHRIIWALANRIALDDVPTKIDHRDTCTTNNRILNLRPANDGENARNASLRTDNRSGHKGVGWVRSESKWQARITVSGTLIQLGKYNRIEDAVAAREAAQHLHGDFGRLA